MITNLLEGKTPDQLSLHTNFWFYASSGEDENVPQYSGSYFKHIQVNSGVRGQYLGVSTYQTNIMRFQVFTSEGELNHGFSLLLN